MDKLKEEDEDAYNESMQNAYLLITQQLNFNELFEYNGCPLPYHPKKR